jgi:hypothetical protein
MLYLFEGCNLFIPFNIFRIMFGLLMNTYQAGKAKTAFANSMLTQNLHCVTRLEVLEQTSTAA